MRPVSRLAGIAATVLESRETYHNIGAWAEANVVLPSSSAFPGPMKVDRFPPMRAIMDAMSITSSAWKVVVMASAQIGKSTAINAAIGQRIDECPAPILLVQPRGEDVAEYVTSRLDSMFASTPRLRDLVGKTEVGGEGVDNVAQKSFPGGDLFVRGARSRATYRGDPIAMVILDDLDAYTANPEGDHVELATARTNTFRLAGRKVLCISTPGDKPSLIEREYSKSSQRQFWVPCLGCGAFQTLEPSNMVWMERKFYTAHFRCLHCAGAIYQRQIKAMLHEGEWRAQKPEMEGVSEGFHIWQGYLPAEFGSFAEYAEAKTKAADQLKAEHRDDLMRAVANVREARPWVPMAQIRLEGIERDAFMRREKPFDPLTLPIHCTVAGCDVQANRIEFLTLGCGAQEESWILDYRVVKGDVDSNELWDSWADQVLASGAQAICIDAGDNQTRVCGQLTRLFERFVEARVLLWATKGFAGHGKLWPGFVVPGNPKLGLVHPVNVYVDEGKSQIYRSMSEQIAHGPNAIHIPNTLGPAWFRQLFAERPREAEDGRGKSLFVMVPGRRRNEALDTLVLAKAAALAYGAIDRDVGNSLSGAGETSPARRPTPPSKRTPPTRRKPMRRNRSDAVF